MVCTSILMSSPMWLSHSDSCHELIRKMQHGLYFHFDVVSHVLVVSPSLVPARKGDAPTLSG